MSTSPYWARVRVGRGLDYHTWTCNGGDPAAYGPLAGLTITQSVLDDLWPPADAPAECRMQIIAPTFAAVPHLRLGAMVEVIVKTPGELDTTVATFNGRIADLTARPHRLGVIFTLVCVDFTADLRDRTITVPSDPVFGDGWDEGTALGWLRGLCERLGYDDPPPVAAVATPNGMQAPTYNDGPQFSVINETTEMNAYEYAQRVARQWYMDFPGYPAGGIARGVLTPVLGDGPMNPPTSWKVVPRFENPAYTGALRMTYSGGRWNVVAVDTAATNLMPAAAVDFDSTWAETREAAPNRVEVSHTYPDDVVETVVASLGVDPTVTLALEVDVFTAFDLTQIARLYLPAERAGQTWLADAFTYYAALDTPGTAVPPDLSAVVTVAGIPPEHNPSGKAWFAGQVAARTLTIAGQQITIEVELRRADFAPSPSGTLTWGSPALGLNPGGNPTPTWANLDPALTWDDLRLTRGSLV